MSGPARFFACPARLGSSRARFFPCPARPGSALRLAGTIAYPALRVRRSARLGASVRRAALFAPWRAAWARSPTACDRVLSACSACSACAACAACAACSSTARIRAGAGPAHGTVGGRHGTRPRGLVRTATRPRRHRARVGVRAVLRVLEVVRRAPVQVLVQALMRGACPEREFRWERRRWQARHARLSMERRREGAATPGGRGGRMGLRARADAARSPVTRADARGAGAGERMPTGRTSAARTPAKRGRDPGALRHRSPASPSLTRSPELPRSSRSDRHPRAVRLPVRDLPRAVGANPREWSLE